MFQSTHPHGVRLLSRISYNSSLSVSIHAPTRGATSPPLHLPAVPCRFNPRTHTGCDLKERRKELVGEGFQSTHPHGVRRYCFLPHDIRLVCFNPRTHTGCDAPKMHITNVHRVSIHAPTRGATSNRSSFLMLLPPRFNPRTHTGCDTQLKSYIRIFQCFNPRTHTGCDKAERQTKRGSREFQSTHPHGVRQCAKLHIISQ